MFFTLFIFYFLIKMAVVNVKVANIRPQGFMNLEQWVQDPMNVYIGRAGVVFIDNMRYPKEQSIWANPYKVGEGKGKFTREHALTLYEVYIRKRIRDEIGVAELLKLKGKRLGCWCCPEACHGDVLVKLIQEAEEKGSV